MGNICYLNTKKQKKVNNWKKDQRMPFKAEAAKWVNKLNFRVWHSNTWNQVVSDRLHVYGSDKVKEWLTSSVSFKHSGHIPTWKQIVRECKYNSSVCTSDPQTISSTMPSMLHFTQSCVIVHWQRVFMQHRQPQPPGAVYARLMQWFTQNKVQCMHAQESCSYEELVFCFAFFVSHRSTGWLPPNYPAHSVREPSAVAHLRQGLGESFIAKCLQI